MSSKSLLSILTLVALSANAHSAVVLGDWISPTGFPTSSESPGYTFVTAHDQGTGSSEVELGFVGPVSVQFFSITNNHTSDHIEIDRIELVMTGVGVQAGISIGNAPQPAEIDDGIVLVGETPYTILPFGSSSPLFSVDPGETFYVIPYAFDGGSFGINRVTITGTAIPEPGVGALSVLAVGALLLRRRL